MFFCNVQKPSYLRVSRSVMRLQVYIYYSFLSTNGSPTSQTFTTIEEWLIYNHILTSVIIYSEFLPLQLSHHVVLPASSRGTRSV